MKPEIAPALIQRLPVMGHALGMLVFDILKYLHGLGEIALANSIWQSWRKPLVDWGDPILPDQVCDALFSHPRVVKEPWRTLQFDIDKRGGYHQQWLLDRIMTDGKVWVGQYA